MGSLLSVCSLSLVHFDLEIGGCLPVSSKVLWFGGHGEQCPLVPAEMETRGLLAISLKRL